MMAALAPVEAVETKGTAFTLQRVEVDANPAEGVTALVGQARCLTRRQKIGLKEAR